MKQPEFVHLHVHSEYSLLDGACRIKDLIAKAKEMGMPAVALTDHGNLYGCIDFYSQAKDAGIKPVLGLECYVTDSDLSVKNKERGTLYHVTLLAQDNEGYRNLLKISSRAFLEGFYYKPRVNLPLLAEHADGVVCLSGCLQSKINQSILSGHVDQAFDAAKALYDIYGDRLFIELQNNGMSEQRACIAPALEIAQKLGVRPVATNDVHYLEREDAEAQDILLCINTGKVLDDPKRMRFSTDEFYFRSAEEMAKAIPDVPEALENTLLIAEMCNVELDFKGFHLPEFTPPDGLTPEEYLEKLCKEGLKRRYPNPTKEVHDRVAYELSIIKRMGFAPYFLIVWDFIYYAKSRGIPVGPGRGSGAGSVVAYLLGITDIDPLKYGLLFERFLNADRISMPDFDVDFCEERRDEVIRYVREKYGDDHVAQIITFGRMKARAVVRDVGRALGMPLAEVDLLAKKIPEALGTTLDEALEREPELREAYETRDDVRKLFDISRKLEGLARHASVHAAGVVISDRPLTNYMALARTGEVITTQLPGETLEKIGMLKADFLSLRTLTIIDKALRFIKRRHGKEIDLATLPLDDPDTYALLCRGETTGVFQLESSGMRELVQRLRPDRISDVIALLALYRPGPLGSGMVDSFVNRKHGQEPIEYPHPCLEPILEETYGVILYQEQVMKIASELSGFSLNEADTLRKAMGKKKRELLVKFHEKFVKGAEERGVDPDLANRIFQLIEHFAGYGFNKSHSTAYAMVSYQTAWLKAHYPTEFMAALMSCESGNTTKIVRFIEECRRMKIRVLPPSVNESDEGFTPTEDDAIRFGLGAIRNVGSRAIESILKARESVGEFKSLHHFLREVDTRSVTKQVVDSLIKAGALDCLPGNRAQKVAALDDAMRSASYRQRTTKRGQLSLFDVSDEEETVQPLPEVEEWSERERLAYEKEMLGYFISGHPLAEYEGLIRLYATHDTASLADVPDGASVTIAGVIQNLRRTRTRRGDPMAQFTIGDQYGACRAIAFKEVVAQSEDLLVADAVCFFSGEIDHRGGEPNLQVHLITPVDRVEEKLSGMVLFRLQSSAFSAKDLASLRELVGRHHGDRPLVLEMITPRNDRVLVKAGPNCWVECTREFVEEARELLGRENVLLLPKNGNGGTLVRGLANGNGNGGNGNNKRNKFRRRS